MEKKQILPTREVLVKLVSNVLSVRDTLTTEFNKVFLDATFDAIRHFEYTAHIRFECKTESEMRKLTKLVDMAGFTVFNDKFEDGFMEFDASFESPSFVASRSAIRRLGTTAEETRICAEVEIAIESKKMLEVHFNNQAKEAATKRKFEYRFDIENLNRNVAKNIHGTLVDGYKLSVRTDYSPTVTKFLVSWSLDGTLDGEGFYDDNEG